MKHLRIGWATPWNERSSIATRASEVATELARRGHLVTVLRIEAEGARDLPPIPAPGYVMHIDDMCDNTLRREFDVIVGQIGNYYDFHGALIPRFDGLDIVGIFHDVLLAGLLTGWARHHGGEVELRRIVRQTYGAGSLADDEPLWIDSGSLAQRRPMLEWFSKRTVAAVAHAEHYAERLRRTCPGPVAVLPLSFVAPHLPPPPATPGVENIAVIGHANANKCIDKLIMAIGASPILRDRCRLSVIGQFEEEERCRLSDIATIVRAHPLVFTGWVDDDKLYDSLRNIHVMSCLRNPVLEGASGSLMLALASGRPTLVTDHGCYAEVPPGMVLPCRPGHEALDAMRYLEWLSGARQEAAAMAARAQEWVIRRHSPAAYVDGLLPLLERVVEERPWREARRSIRSTLMTFGLQDSDPALQRADAAFDSLGKIRARERCDAMGGQSR